MLELISEKPVLKVELFNTLGRTLKVLEEYQTLLSKREILEFPSPEGTILFTPNTRYQYLYGDRE